MVLGNGLVANNLSAYQTDDSVLIFASGVSNSGEKKESAFERESGYLLSVKNTPAKLIYFSTCSLFDPDLVHADYVLHKRRVESLIADNFKDYLILRLPQLIANTPNPYTFYNFIAQRILLNEKLQVHKNAWRYLFDAADLGVMIPLLLKELTPGGKVFNMAYSNATPVSELVSLFEQILGKEAQKEYVDKGSFYEFDNVEFTSLLKKYDIGFEKKSYNRNTLTKYLTLLKG